MSKELIKEKFVTLNVRESTKKRFNEFGIKGQTDDQLLNHFMDEAEFVKKFLPNEKP